MPPKTRSADPKTVPMAKASKAITKTAFEATKVCRELKKKRDARGFTAQPELRLDQTGICHINTGLMDQRSQLEVYNYAFLVNKYIQGQKGGKVKIKSTIKRRNAQAGFCAAVRKQCKDLLGTLNHGKKPKHKMFSVVAHVPDECIQVHSFGANHNQLASTGTNGIGKAPGWLPMTNQANNLVSKIGLQTLNSSGQNDGPYIKEFRVDSFVPGGLLEVPAYTNALGKDPFE